MICKVDDVIIYGMDDDQNLEAFSTRCEQKGLKLNPSKLEYKMNVVSFMVTY